MAIDLFPNLSRDEKISVKTGRVERSWLDEDTIKSPGYLEKFFHSFYFLRITGTMAELDEATRRLRPSRLNTSMCAAMGAQKIPLLYIVRCDKGAVHIIIGTSHECSTALSGLLDALPGRSLYSPCDGCEIALPGMFSHCAALTGIPWSPPKTPVSMSAAQDTSHEIDQLLTGLYAESWLYVVQTVPVELERISQWVEMCAREIQDTKESYLHSQFQQADRMAAHYVEVLEKYMARFRLGKQLGMWQAGIYLLSSNAQTVARGAAILASLYAAEKTAPEPLRIHTCSQSGSLSPLINLYHSREVEQLISFPGREYNGFKLKEQPAFDADFEPRGKVPIAIGPICSAGHDGAHQFSIDVDDLVKHALVAGVTGSGKTNTVFNLLVNLYNGGNKIPFLVIEPAKSEYRALWRQIPSLYIFTLGEERPGVSSPFRINPFAFPKGISLQTHIDYLKAVFNASFVMYAPMPYVLEDCLYRIYEDKGWNLVTSTNARGEAGQAFPTLLDLYNKIGPVVDVLGYESRTALDIKAALKTRINNLCVGGKGLMLNTPVSTPFHEIMQQPTVLELKSMGNEDEKVFMMGLVLTALYEYYEAGHAESKGLNHLTVIEEAHRLLKNVPTEKSSEDMANIKGKGIETFCNLLSEIRAYGEGILVAEQIPSKLAPDVIKNTSLKIMHRIVSKEDRDVMGDAMNMDAAQKRYAIAFEKGEAAAFSEGLDRPVLIRPPLSPLKNPEAKDVSVRVADAAVHSLMRDGFFKAHPELLQKMSACSSCSFFAKAACSETDRAVAELLTGDNAAEYGVRFFAPYLLNGAPDDAEAVKDHLKSIVDPKESIEYCFKAHLLEQYIRAKGDFHKWPFVFIEQLLADVHREISSGNFSPVIVSRCRGEVSEKKWLHPACKAFCQQKNLICFEGSILGRDAEMHNRLCDLLASDLQGQTFSSALASELMDFIRDNFEGAETSIARQLATCYLIQKLNERGFSLPIQKLILNGFTTYLAQTE